MSCCLILPCAGSGERLGGQAKQLRLVNHKPLFIHSLLAFVGMVEHIIIPCSPPLIPEIEAALAEHRISAQIVPGGDSRLESVANALKACPGHCDMVLIHDAVRPCVSTHIIRHCLDALITERAVITAVPCTDTLKTVNNGVSINTLNRNYIYLAQTPQGFKTEGMLALYTQAIEQGQEYTDDAGLCEAHGIPVSVVMGSRDNIKVTYTEDLALAGFLLSTRHH